MDFSEDELERRWAQALKRLRNHLFERDVEPLRGELRRYCTRLTGDAATGEDLEQETMLRGFGAVCQICGGPLRVKAYLYRIATNLWIDRRRRHRREASAHAHLAQVVGPPRWEETAVEQLARVTQSLSPRELEVFLLREVQGYSVVESAALLGVTEAAVKMAAARGRQRAQRALA
jgi:RNA polymerase sigma-70 factor (ECF subfamily)